MGCEVKMIIDPSNKVVADVHKASASVHFTSLITEVCVYYCTLLQLTVCLTAPYSLLDLTVSYCASYCILLRLTASYYILLHLTTSYCVSYCTSLHLTVP